MGDKDFKLDRKERRGNTDISGYTKKDLKEYQRELLRRRKPGETTQVERVLRKFGKPRHLRNAMLVATNNDTSRVPSLVSIYQWRKEIMGGVIPSRWIPLIIAAAATEGITLDEHDLYPGIK